MDPIYYILPIALIAFPLFFMLIIFIVANLGWRRISEQYRCDEEINGNNLQFCSARIGFTNYNNILKVIWSDQGIYMRPQLMFKFAHPGIFIPWRDLEFEGENSFLFIKFISFTTRPETKKIKFHGRTALRILEAYKLNQNK